MNHSLKVQMPWGCRGRGGGGEMSHCYQRINQFKYITLSHKKGLTNLLSIIVTTSILSWFFLSFKIGDMFGVKDPILHGLHTCVVYKFLYVDYNACYISETFLHLSTRMHEHLVNDRSSHIFRHLHNSPQCYTLYSDECFIILDHISTTFQLKINKAIHIQWE